MTDRVLTDMSQATIDVAIRSAKAKRDAALTAGRLSEAADQDDWIDRLLDARPHHRA